MSKSLFDSRFVINTGKGGVGKTMVSVAMAVAFAQRGKRVLLMQLNVPDRLGAMYGLAPIGPEIVELAPLIDAVDTTPADALREYALMILKVKAVYRAVFENKVVSKLLRVMPGLPELTMLGKAYYHEQERDPRGRARYDVVIIDAPATGHGMFLLQIPQVIASALHTGRMAEESARMLALLEDPQRTVVNIVTLPEEMPANECVELHQQLSRQFDIRVGAVIANQVISPLLAESELANVRMLLNAHGNERDEVGRLLAASVFRERRAALQRTHIDRLRRSVPVPVVEIPYYFEPRFDRTVVDRMAAHITAHIAHAVAA